MKMFESHYLQLFIQFTSRDLTARYKQSFMGITWAIMQPLFMMVIFTVVFGKFAKIPSDGIPYPLFSYAALLPWTLLATSMNYGVNSLINNVTLITKIYFPREVLPLSSIAAAFVDFMVASVIFIGMMIWYKIPLSSAILFIFPMILLQLLLIITVVLIFSVWNVRYRDVRHGLPFLIQCWMYASPIVYPISIIPDKWRQIYSLNPMAGLIDGYRAILLRGELPLLQTLLPAILFVLVGLPLSYCYFKKTERKFADII